MKQLFIISVIFTAATILVLLGLHVFLYNSLPSKLPLFYSLPWGESQLVLKQQFFILPAILGFVALLNLFIASQLHEAQWLLKRILIFSVVVLALIILITALKIIFIYI